MKLKYILKENFNINFKERNDMGEIVAASYLYTFETFM